MNRLIYPKSAEKKTAKLHFVMEVRSDEVTAIQRSSGIFRGEHADGTTLRLEGGRKVFVKDPMTAVIAKFQAAGVPVPEELC